MSSEANARVPTRTVHCADALQWLPQQALAPHEAVFTSLPDSSELRRLTFEQWEEWFVEAARRVAAAVHPDSAAVFYQTDVKRLGNWVDKSFLVQCGTRAAGARLLWHKVVCRAPAGTATGGRPGYAHLLCVSRNLRDDSAFATADVVPRLGTMTWPKAIGLAAAEAGVAWLRDRASARCIVDPFCGMGTVLAVANRAGLDAVGVEVAASRAEKARKLVL